ncbi:hypothetical protein ES707_12195 [subsurface metagenome]
MAADLQGHCLRAARGRIPSRRRGLDPVQRGARMGLCRHGYPLRRRRFLRHLSDRLRGSSRISHQRLPHPRRLRRGRGATRQDPDLPLALPDAVKDRGLRHGRPDRLLRSDGAVACRIHGARPEPRAGPRRAVGRDGWQPHQQRPCGPRLYLRHDWTAEGRHAFQPQRHAPDASRQRSLPVDRFGREAGVPAAVPRRRARRRLLRLDGARFGDEFRREPGNRAGQSARGAADRLPRRAAGLGKILFRHHHRAEGCDLAAEMDVCEGAGDRQPHDGMPARRRDAFAWAPRRQQVRLLAGVPQHPPHARARSLPHRLYGCRADLPGPDPLVSRDRHRHARGLRPDRELRRRHLDAD